MRAAIAIEAETFRGVSRSAAGRQPADMTSAEDRSQERLLDRNCKQSMKNFWHLEITAISSSMKFRA